MNSGYENLPELSRQLLPCPICGGTAHLANYEGGEHGTAKERRELKGKTEVVVECSGYCGISIWGATTPQEAIKRWNRRAESTDLKPCPFCGSPAKLIKGVPMWFEGDDMYYVRCTNPKCNAERWGEQTSTKAVENWNKRSTQKGETND